MAAATRQLTLEPPALLQPGKSAVPGPEEDGRVPTARGKFGVWDRAGVGAGGGGTGESGARGRFGGVAEFDPGEGVRGGFRSAGVVGEFGADSAGGVLSGEAVSASEGLGAQGSVYYG